MQKTIKSAVASRLRNIKKKKQIFCSNLEQADYLANFLERRYKGWNRKMEKKREQFPSGFMEN